MSELDPEAFLQRYGPWAVVLGAGQGLGRAFAHALAARGLNLLLVDQRPDSLEQVRAELGRAHEVQVRTAEVDLAAPGVAGSLEAAASELDVGLVVYTAMISLVGPFLDQALERHLQLVGVGCRGVLVAAHRFGSALRQRGRGGLILTSSLAGFQGTGWVASYSACKAFDLALAEALWWELRPHGVDVLALAPGSTETPGLMQHRPHLDPAALQSPEEVAAEALSALGRQPLLVSGEDNRRLRQALEALPRQQLVELMGEQTRRQFEPEGGA